MRNPVLKFNFFALDCKQQINMLDFELCLFFFTFGNITDISVELLFFLRKQSHSQEDKSLALIFPKLAHKITQ